MTASIWVALFVGWLVFVSLVMVTVAAGGYLLWRYGRRRWLALRSHGAVVGAGLLWTAVSSRYMRPRPPGSPGDMRGWPPRTVRREMWRSLDLAESAVRTADDLGGATASLPVLCRRLRHGAIAVDRVLRVEQDRTAPPELVAQAFEVIRAATDIRNAAVASAGDATGRQVEDLARDADYEIRCLDAGLASARAALPHPGR